MAAIRELHTARVESGFAPTSKVGRMPCGSAQGAIFKLQLDSAEVSENEMALKTRGVERLVEQLRQSREAEGKTTTELQQNERSRAQFKTAEAVWTVVQVATPLFMLAGQVSDNPAQAALLAGSAGLAAIRGAATLLDTQGYDLFRRLAEHCVANPSDKEGVQKWADRLSFSVGALSSVLSLATGKAAAKSAWDLFFNTEGTFFAPLQHMVTPFLEWKGQSHGIKSLRLQGDQLRQGAERQIRQGRLREVQVAFQQQMDGILTTFKDITALMSLDGKTRQQLLQAWG